MNLKKRLKSPLFLILYILFLIVAIALLPIVVDTENYWVQQGGLCSRSMGRLYGGIFWHIREYGVFPTKEELPGLVKWPGAEKSISWCPITNVDYIYNKPEVTSPDNFVVLSCPVHNIKEEKKWFNKTICDRNMEALAYGICDYMKEHGKFPIQIKEISEESEFGRRPHYCPITKVDYVYNKPEDTSPDNFVVLSCPVHTPMYNIKIEKGLINKLSIEK